MRDTGKGGICFIEAMEARGSERPRTEHRLTEIPIGEAPSFGFEIMDLVTRTSGRTIVRKVLLGTVVNTGNRKRKELERKRGDDLMLRRRGEGKAHLFAGEIVVIMDDRYEPGCPFSAFSRLGHLRESAQVIRWRLKSPRDIAQHLFGVSDFECSV